MLEYIKGIAAELTPTYAVIENNGIGYMLNISLPAFEELQRSAGEVKMLVHEIIREDAHTLYGFMAAKEREMFRLLIGVSGVGPGTAMLILSSIPVADLEAVITSWRSQQAQKCQGNRRKDSPTHNS